MKIMSRQEAIAAGLKRYFTGKPCPQGHLVEHKISGACVECARLDKQRWRKANPERVKALKSAEQKRNRAKANERAQRWYSANADQAKAATAAWARQNPGKNSAKTSRRRSAQLQRTPAWADMQKIDRVYSLCARYRGYGLDFHVDHVIPLQGKTVCGLHVHNNLAIIEASANRSKSNHL